jgi:hypothetical protein
MGDIKINSPNQVFPSFYHPKYRLSSWSSWCINVFNSVLVTRCRIQDRSRRAQFGFHRFSLVPDVLKLVVWTVYPRFKLNIHNTDKCLRWTLWISIKSIAYVKWQLLYDKMFLKKFIRFCSVSIFRRLFYWSNKSLRFHSHVNLPSWAYFAFIMVLPLLEVQEL